MKNRILYFLVLATISSCNTPSKDSTDSDTSTSSQNITPESLGLNSDSLALIENHFQWAMDSSFIAGGVALVAKNNQIAFYKAFGFSDRAKTKTLQKDAIFRMASMTKPIASLAVMQLHEQGKLNVADPVSKYIPEFANSQVIENFNPEDGSYSTRPAQNELTIHHLLTHTSGLAYDSDPVASQVYPPFDIILAISKDSILLENNIPKMGRLPLMHEPGAQFTYGISIDVLGRIIEIVSGLPFDQYLQKNVFEPLGMVDTYFYLPENKYDRLVDVWFTPEANPDNYLSADYPIAGAMTYFSGGAGLVSTAMDYLQFASALLNNGKWNGNKVLQEETTKMMMSNQIDSLFQSEGVKYGYGGSVYETDGPYGRKAGRFSWGGYWQTNYWVDPQRDMITIIMTNARETPRWNELFDGYEQIVNNAVLEQ